LGDGLYLSGRPESGISLLLKEKGDQKKARAKKRGKKKTGGEFASVPTLLDVLKEDDSLRKQEIWFPCEIRRNVRGCAKDRIKKDNEKQRKKTQHTTKEEPTILCREDFRETLGAAEFGKKRAWKPGGLKGRLVKK